MSDSSPHSTGNTDDTNENPELNLRSRTKRIESAEFSVWTKIPNDTSSEMLEANQRLSRKVHLPEILAEDFSAKDDLSGNDSVEKDMVIEEADMPHDHEEEEASPQAEYIFAEDEPKVSEDEISEEQTTESNEWKEENNFYEEQEEMQKEAFILPKFQDLPPQPSPATFLEDIRKSDHTEKNISSVVPKRGHVEAKMESRPRKHSQTLKEILKFVGIGTAIFFFTLVGINFPAYYDIARNLVYPQEVAQLGENLSAVTASNIVQHPRLLPMAGIERHDPPKLQSFLEVIPPDDRLIIPRIGKNVPIVTDVGVDALQSGDWKRLEDEIQQGLQRGVIHYPGTAFPGEEGNFFLTGHSSYYPWDKGKYKDVFALLGKLKVGDTYTVYFRQKKYTYRIFEEKIVKPEDTSVLDQPVGEKDATLMTCWPPGTTTLRKIYHARLVEE